MMATTTHRPGMPKVSKTRAIGHERGPGARRARPGPRGGSDGPPIRDARLWRRGPGPSTMAVDLGAPMEAVDRRRRRHGGPWRWVMPHRVLVAYGSRHGSTEGI